MPTPSIQTLTTDAQQILNLDSISSVRSVVAVALANANTGTPLNPNLTTQQLWDQFYQVVTRPKSDIESIIANQLMKFLYSPPAPGGAGADKQVIFNDGGVLAGDADFLWNKTTNLLTVTGAATITGDLTVDTNTLKVDSANNRVGIGTASPAAPLDVQSNASGTGIMIRGRADNSNALRLYANDGTTQQGYIGADNSNIDFLSEGGRPLRFFSNSLLQYQINPLGVFTWYDGAGGTRMTLNSTGLGVGGSPNDKLEVVGSGGAGIRVSRSGVATQYTTLSAGATGPSLDASSAIGALTFGVAGSTKMTVDTSGNVGVGVTPSAWVSTVKALDISSGGAVYAGSLNCGLAANYYLNSSGNYIYKTTAFAAGYIPNYANNGSHVWFNAPSGTAGNAITFTQAMTLTADGELLVGTASVGGVFDTKFYLSSNSGTNKWAVGPYGTATNFAIIPTPGTGGVYLSGTSATSWTAYSDERLKDIIEPITNALTKVGSLRSVIGKFKGDEANTRRPFLIAQDLQSALPEAVDASNPDRLGVAYTDVIPLLVAAIKELTAEVNALKNA